MLAASFVGEDSSVEAEAAANSNVGKTALAAFSRSLSGFAELRGVVFGSENVNVLATSGDFSTSLGRDLRADDPTLFGTLKSSSVLVGDIDHFVTGFDPLLGLLILGFAATPCFLPWVSNIEP